MSHPKVLFYLDSLAVGGVERIVINTTLGLSRAGWDVEIALNQARGELLEAVGQGIVVHDLRSDRFHSCVSALAGLIRAKRPAIVISQRAYLNAIAVLATIASSQAPKLVLAEHSLLSRWLRDTRAPKRRVDHVLPHVLPLLYRRADAIVGISRGVARDLETMLRLPPGRVHVLYNPLIDGDPETLINGDSEPLIDRDSETLREGDPETLREGDPEPLVDGDPEAHRGLPGAGLPLIVGLGRLSPEKGFDLLIRAFERVVARTPARLAIVGSGPELPRLRALAESLRLDEHVVFPGYQRDPYLWLRRAAVFALSSAIESFPSVVVESMAIGTPVVAFDCPEGPREIITHGRDGLLVPAGDPAALGEGILQVLGNPELAAELAKHGRLRAGDFTFDRTIQGYCRLFEQIVGYGAATAA